MAAPMKEQVGRITEILRNNWLPGIAEEAGVEYWQAVAIDLFRHCMVHGVRFAIKEDTTGLT